MDMDEQQFTQQVEAFFTKLGGLLAESESSVQPRSSFSPEAIEELQVLAEELQVASEELRQKNEALLEANAKMEAERLRYQQLFEFAPDGYLVTDALGVILEANRAACLMLNLTPETILRKPLAAYIHQPDLPAFRSRLTYLDQQGKEVPRPNTLPSFLPAAITDWEVHIRPRDREVFPASLTVAVVPSAEGQPSITLRWMMRDISERKQSRQALQAAKDDLEIRVADRTAQLKQANENLKRFALQLERRNRELQDFASIASHDLQEPLRKIQSFGNLLSAHKQASLGKDGADYVRRMVDAAGRMQAMVVELLQYARVNTRGDTFEPVNLEQIAADVLADLEARVLQTGGRVELSSLPIIEADQLQMRQLFQNLIGNGLKFHQQYLAPEVKVWADFPEPEAVVIYVQDNGIGMDPKYVEQIFEPFHRLHGRSEYEGTGMGLSICRKIVERHNGQIIVESQPDEGTTFIVKLPVTHSSPDLPNVGV